MTETAIEAPPQREKKACKFGAKCRRKGCKFLHPNPTDAATNAHGEHNSVLHEIEKDSNSQPSSLEISCLLGNLMEKNDATLTAISANAKLISKLQGENASLLNTTQAIRKDLDKLQEHVRNQNKENNERNLALTAQVEHDSFAKQLSEAAALEAQLRLEQEQRESQRLKQELKLARQELETSQGELKVSQDLVRQLLVKSNPSKEVGSDKKSKSSKPGQVLATVGEPRGGQVLATRTNRDTSASNNVKSMDKPIKSLGTMLAISAEPSANDTVSRGINETDDIQDKPLLSVVTPVTISTTSSPSSFVGDFLPSDAGNAAKTESVKQQQSLKTIQSDAELARRLQEEEEEAMVQKESWTKVRQRSNDATEVKPKTSRVQKSKSAKDDGDSKTTKASRSKNEAQKVQKRPKVEQQKLRQKKPIDTAEPAKRKVETSPRNEETEEQRAIAREAAKPPAYQQEEVSTAQRELSQGGPSEVTTRFEQKVAPSSISSLVNKGRTRSSRDASKKSKPVTIQKPVPLSLPPNTRLSLYLYPKKPTKKNIRVSPIFKLLHDPTTLGTARTLLRYESEMLSRENELQELEKGKNRVEASIMEEKRVLSDHDREIEKLDREYRTLQGEWGVFDAGRGIWKSYIEPVFKPQKPIKEIPDETKDYYALARKELIDAHTAEEKVLEEEGDPKSDKDFEPPVEEIKKLAAKRQKTDEDERDVSRRQLAMQKQNEKAWLESSKTGRTKRMRLIYKTQQDIKELKKDIPARIESLQAESMKWDQPILEKEQQISELKSKISKLTVAGREERSLLRRLISAPSSAEVVGGEETYDDFHIDDSRNEDGQSFLMVAAQNNDVETAKLCLQLGADPNVSNRDGFTAMSFAYVFKFREMMDLLSKNGATYPTRQVEAWSNIIDSDLSDLENLVDWETTLRIAEQAAIPTETVLQSACELEASEEFRMAVLSEEDSKDRDFVFFDKSIAGGQFNASSMRRTVLLSEDVYRWFCDSEASSKAALLSLLDALKPDNLRQQQSCGERAICTRRSVVGMKKTYEVLCAAMGEGSNLVCLFTPFVTSAVEGVADVGVLVWAITASHNASLIKTLIESTEFLRHKVDDDEVFPPHEKEVLELGKDVHLLDLRSTSIFTTKPLELYILNVDEGDIERLDSDDFVPKKRIAYYEQQLNRAIFEASEEEARENEAILSAEKAGMSTSLVGGAGTGKTLLMTKKIVSVPHERKVLVVSRLPRLVSVVKGAVERESHAGNVTFSTYDDLLALLVRSVTPPDESQHHGFSAFSKVQFETSVEAEGDTSVSFVDGFVGSFLGGKERKAMKDSLVEPMTLWTAFRTIKSSARCALKKEPLSRDYYMTLPKTFGLTSEQRSVVYDLYLRYEEWLHFGRFKWDEADRVLYILKYGPSVFSDDNYKSWERRAYRLGEVELLEDDGVSPLSPFFYDLVFADEAQDFTELDLTLFLRMSGGVRSLFIGADPAQSVELGIRMRAGTINDVFHSSLSSKMGIHVKNVLQQIQMRTNHRTHQQNLALATAVRSILARSFGVPITNENALINGPIPEGLTLQRVSDLADRKVFSGGNIVFLAPDEVVDDMRARLTKLGVQNDVFGVREAKGLEFNDVALIGFFSYIDELGSSREWENCLRWLSSSTGLTTVESSEKVQGRQLESCDYTLSHPEILDQAMLLYTALTRARNHLYLIEIKELSASRNGGGRGKGRGAAVGLDDFAFRRFKDLGLIKMSKSINEGHVEMTPAQHKARGVLLVTQAINLSRSGTASVAAVKEKFLEAADRFRSDKGNDKELLDQCIKHMDAVLLKRSLVETIEKQFFDRTNGKYVLEGRFADILRLEQDCSKFFSLCIGDSFLVDEIASIRKLMEEMFVGTPYYIRFGEICQAIKQHEP